MDRLEAVSVVRDALAEKHAEIRARRERLLSLVCHPECMDSDGHVDSCLHDDAESLIP